MQWAKEYGPLVAHAVAHPDAVKHILFDNNDNYQKAPHSMMEATLIVAALLQRYDLHLDLSRPVYTSCSSPELAQ